MSKILTVIMVLFSITAFAQEKPNIVFMMADNLGYGDVGVYGGGELRGAPTPRIDGLARDGLRFTQFLVEPGCTPSRAATMTSRYSIRSGLSLVIVPGTTNTLAAEEVTMAEVMKTVGYDTAYFGKWHLGTETPTLFSMNVACSTGSFECVHIPQVGICQVRIKPAYGVLDTDTLKG